MKRLLAFPFLFLFLLSLALPASSAAEESSAGPPKAKMVVVKATKTIVRDKASSKGKSLLSLAMLTPVEVIDRGESWTRIKTPGGIRGYVPSSSLAKSAYVSVDGQKANARSGPEPQDPVLFSLKNHYPLRVIGRKAKRVKVRDFEGDEGWIHENLLSTKRYVVVRLGLINLREGPNTEHPKRFKAERGVVFEVLEERQGWLLVKHSDGDEGWCSAKIVWGWLEE